MDRCKKQIDTINTALVLRNNFSYSCTEFFEIVQDQTDLLIVVRSSAKNKFKK